VIDSTITTTLNKAIADTA